MTFFDQNSHNLHKALINSKNILHYIFIVDRVSCLNYHIYMNARQHGDDHPKTHLTQNMDSDGFL